MKKLILPVISFIVITYTCLSLLFPSPNLQRIEYQCQDNDIVRSLTVQDLTEAKNCFVGSNGIITAANSNPQVTFGHLDTKCQALEIVLNDNASRSVSVDLLLVAEDGEETTISTYCLAGSNSIKAAVPENHYQSVTISSLSKAYNFLKTLPFSIKVVNFHSRPAAKVTLPYQEPNKMLYFCISFAVGLISALLIYLIDRKKGFSQKWLTRRHLNRFVKSAGQVLMALLVCGIISALLEWLIAAQMTGVRSDGKLFSFQRFVWIDGILLTIWCFVKERKTIVKNPEKLFLCLLLIIGAVMVFAAPFGHISPDTDSHFNWTFSASYFLTKIKNFGDYFILHQSKVGSLYWPGSNAATNTSSMATFNQVSDTLYSFTNSTPSAPHILSGIFLAWARFTGLQYASCIMFAKLATVLIYAFVCYFAMKKLKSGKMILAVIGMIPTSLFIAANFSYDYWVTCFTILGMAWFIGEMQQPEKEIKMRDTIIMCGALALGCIPKSIYVPLMIFPFFMNRKKIKNKKRYYLICAGAIIAIALLFAFKSFMGASGSGDSRGGSDVNALLQVRFILQNPWQYTKILLNFLGEYLSASNMPYLISNFAYLGNGQGTSVILVLMFFTMLTDKSDCDRYATNGLIRAYALLMFFALAALIATALYISFTPVGLETINGCQARYLIPLLYPLLAVLGSYKIKNPFNPNIYPYLVLVPCCAVNFYMIYTLMVMCWI